MPELSLYIPRSNSPSLDRLPGVGPGGPGDPDGRDGPDGPNLMIP